MSRESVLDEVKAPRRIVVVFKTLEGENLNTLLIEEDDNLDQIKGVMVGMIQSSFRRIP